MPFIQMRTHEFRGDMYDSCFRMVEKPLFVNPDATGTPEDFLEFQEKNWEMVVTQSMIQSIAEHRFLLKNPAAWRQRFIKAREQKKEWDLLTLNHGSEFFQEVADQPSYMGAMRYVEAMKLAESLFPQSK